MAAPKIRPKSGRDSSASGTIRSKHGGRDSKTHPIQRSWSSDRSMSASNQQIQIGSPSTTAPSASSLSLSSDLVRANPHFPAAKTADPSTRSVPTDPGRQPPMVSTAHPLAIAECR
ncbi:hypothetical protein ACLOJK_014626, partial [Asimina triloba]